MSESAAMKSVQSDDIDYLELDRVIEMQFSGDTENLIMMLQAIQGLYNYLPPPAVAYLAAKIGVPLSRLYEVATFYSTFSLAPRGRHLISTCLGTACHVRGAARVQERLEDILELEPGQTTADRRFTLESVRCVGCCSLGPVVRINDDIHARISSDRIPKILDQYD